MATSIKLLALSGGALDAFLADRVAANPYLRLRRPVLDLSQMQSVAARPPSMHQVIANGLRVKRHAS